MTVSAVTRRVLERLNELGVTEFVVCPGGRNAEFVSALATTPEGDATVHWHFEERSAAFFALGRALQTERPVAVITTSGTAAGEALPAVMEAHLSQAPLLLITADRPARFRGSGAPQSTDQTALYGRHAAFVDIQQAADVPDCLDEHGPTQWNVALEDPRGTISEVPAAAPVSPEAFFSTVARPFVIVGGLTAREASGVADWLLRHQVAHYAEATSQLRADPRLRSLQIRVAENAVARTQADGILRIGGVPTHRLWRDLEDRFAQLPVLNVTRQGWPGLSRPTLTIRELPTVGPPSSVRSNEADVVEQRERLLREFPGSEPALVRAITTAGQGVDLYVGNSLPIRELDLAGDYDFPGRVFASRGLNGIDGQLSTGLGLATPGRHLIILVGDLTALYDLAAPWARMAPDATATIVILNNAGGQIFRRMFPEPAFQNGHDRRFADWARMWDLPYVTATAWPGLEALPEGALRVVELRPDPAQTDAFWNAWQEASR